MEDKTIIKETYCEKCGTKYEYKETHSSYFVRGDWCGHHPDHYESYTENDLEKTPCPKCKTINKRQISLSDLEHMTIKGMSVEQKYKYIISEKIIVNNKKIKDLTEKIVEHNVDIMANNNTIKDILKEVNSNKGLINKNNKIIAELDKISIEDYRQKEQDRLRNLNDEIQQDIIYLFSRRKKLLSCNDEIKDEIQKVQNDIFMIEKENKFYNFELQEDTK